MSKHFRPWKIDEARLPPPDVQDFVPKDHLARFIVARVRESLDLEKIAGGGFETPYRLRKLIAEAVSGLIKQARGFRQFLLRGVARVRAEWAMIRTAHNLTKLFTLAKAA